MEIGMLYGSTVLWLSIIRVLEDTNLGDKRGSIMTKGLKQGIGIFLGLFLSAAFAYTVSGTIKTWTTGDTLTASDLNTTVQSLKTAVEGATQIGMNSFSGTAGGNYGALPYAPYTTTEATQQFPMPRDGVVKSIRVIPTVNSCTGAGTVTLRKNGVDTAVVLSVPASSLAVVTNATTISFVANDVLTWKANCASGGFFGQVYYEF
jgi:hypothetical protein